MRRSSLGEQIQRHPHLAKVLDECWGCHSVGIKPGILGTKHGDYGIPHLLADFQELLVHQSGLCAACAKHPPAEIDSDEHDA